MNVLSFFGLKKNIETDCFQIKKMFNILRKATANEILEAKNNRRGIHNDFTKNFQGRKSVRVTSSPKNNGALKGNLESVFITT